jgi:transposase
MKVKDEVRYRAVVHYCHFLRSLRKVAAVYGVSKSSLQRWVKGRSARMSKTPRSTKRSMAGTIRRCIEKTLTEKPFTTSRELVHILFQQCDGLRISRSTANRMTRRAGFTYKKAFKAVVPRHDAKTVDDFCRGFKSSKDNVVCIDEAGFYIGDHPRRGYSKKGTRLRVAASRTLRRVKLTLIMAVSSEGIVGYEILSHNCRKADYVEFIEHLDVPPGTALLMDNVAFHRSKETLQAIAVKGCRCRGARCNRTDCVPASIEASRRD